MPRVGGAGIVMLMTAGGRRCIGRAGVQPLHRASGDTGSEENEGERQNSAATKKRKHDPKIGPEAAARKDTVSQKAE